MSESIKHECGIALLRLLKPIEYYQEKYGNTWALNRMYLLMEKQHNRGQDGAGFASVKFDTEPGKQYIDIAKSNAQQPIMDIFKNVFSEYKIIEKEQHEKINDIAYLKDNAKFFGELFLGHLRYGTFGRNELENLHPFHRESNWKTKDLLIAGNFNLTNIDEMLNKLISLGQHPVKVTDTAIVLEKIGKFLDREVEELFKKHKLNQESNIEITKSISQEIDIQKILTSSVKHFDGGYVMAGLIGNGDSFVVRDESGIRPCYYFYNDEIAVVASERPAIMTTFDVPLTQVKELTPGCALIIKRDGQISEKRVKESPKAPKRCSFERIYFSRGTDADIYNERKLLGEKIFPQVLDAINGDIKNTVISYIPNTASVAFQGLAKAFGDYLNEQRIKEILNNKDNISEEKLKEIFSTTVRREYIVVKDVKLRTFITQDNERDDMVAHVYDVTYGQIKEGVDNLVVIDDSIVRGTTLKQSILSILDRLGPKKIVVASSAPQIRYPDCYGIDMSRLGHFVAFNAAIELLKEQGKQNIIDKVYQQSKKQEDLPKELVVNYVKDIYEPFTAQEISDKIAQIITPKKCNAEIKVVYNTIENLHISCPNHTGDWYFTGNYPTEGGNKVVNQAFINYYEGNNKRSY
ncbi:MAG: class II glutamine amidotransferase [Bacteroidales bacterium]|jgi:amidophosphoribosyltransferase|nr:class II glutamine amidotransferase [Bacteroidales bacterium]